MIDFQQRPPGGSQEVVDRWLDKLGQRQNIDELVELAAIASGDETYLYDVSANATRKVTLANLLFGLSRFKVGSFTRDVSTASGTQAVTGVGFQPKSIAFITGFASVAAIAWSIGVDTDTDSCALYDNGNLTPGTHFFVSNVSILLQGGVGDFYSGSINSFDTDGFTVSWTKSGTPTGTATIGYLALR